MYKEYDGGCFLLCPGGLRACKVYFNSWKIMTLVNKLLIVGFDMSVLRRRAVEDRMMAEQARRPFLGVVLNTVGCPVLNFIV